MPGTDLTDRELLIVIHDRSERVERALFGNGQPGLMERMAKAEEQLDKRNRSTAAAGGIGAMVTTIITIVATKLGVGF